MTEKHPSRVIQELYNPNHWLERAEVAISGVSPEEARAWRNHPCTKTLQYTIHGYIAGVVNELLQVNLESVDASALSTATAKGKAAALEDMLDHVTEISKGNMEEEA